MGLMRLAFCVPLFYNNNRCTLLNYLQTKSTKMIVVWTFNWLLCVKRVISILLQKYKYKFQKCARSRFLWFIIEKRREISRIANVCQFGLRFYSKIPSSYRKFRKNIFNVIKKCLYLIKATNTVWNSWIKKRLNWQSGFK